MSASISLRGSREIALETLGLLALPTQCLLLLAALGLGRPNRLTARRQRARPLSLERLDLAAGSREIALETLGLLALPTQCLLLLDALGLGRPNRLTARRQRPSPSALSASISLRAAARSRLRRSASSRSRPSASCCSTPLASAARTASPLAASARAPQP